MYINRRHTHTELLQWTKANTNWRLIDRWILVNSLLVAFFPSLFLHLFCSYALHCLCAYVTLHPSITREKERQPAENLMIEMLNDWLTFENVCGLPKWAFGNVDIVVFKRNYRKNLILGEVCVIIWQMYDVLWFVPLSIAIVKWMIVLLHSSFTPQSISFNDGLVIEGDNPFRASKPLQTNHSHWYCLVVYWQALNFYELCVKIYILANFHFTECFEIISFSMNVEHGIVDSKPHWTNKVNENNENNSEMS